MFFCNCAKKHGDCSLIQVCTFLMQEEIRTAAQSLDEKELLTKLTNNDPIALEAKYHKNCLAEALTKAKGDNVIQVGHKATLLLLIQHLKASFLILKHI